MPHIHVKNHKLLLAAGLASLSFGGATTLSATTGFDFTSIHLVQADDGVPESTDTDKYKVRTIAFIDEDDINYPSIQPLQSQYIHLHNDGTDSKADWHRVSTKWENDLKEPNPKMYDFDEKKSDKMDKRMPENLTDWHYKVAINKYYKHHMTKGVTAKMVPDGQKLDLERKAVRTIRLMDGKNVKETITQTATIARTATKDEVTGKLSDFTAWKVEGAGWYADSYKLDGYKRVYVPAKDALLSMADRSDEFQLVNAPKKVVDVRELASDETGDAPVASLEVADEEIVTQAAQEMLAVGHRQPETGKRAAFNFAMLATVVAMTAAGLAFVFYRR
ncbi:hypothetical protein G6R29_02075 [Fructobacillus sp. M2-14]|uniref:Mub B2-like domain-containing protein n=1 Tax=Fructobacillus broussonetiae TaxID=2713173 RepID=A0ABS5QZ10_9LACO|nr:hypothetical protein [Fructobacillus broussonetiae]MBS9338424.1 hypothetical protein [Fructobacillus broussonetiae]